jgi:twin arginine-targeting protein translocase, TatA/E family
MLPNIGMSELLVVLVIVMVIFGAGKLPEIGAGLGKAIRNFKKTATGELDENEKSREKELPKDNASK